MSEVLREAAVEIQEFPRPLAEDIDLHICLAALDKYKSRRTSAGLFHLAWRGVELGLNQAPELNDLDRQDSFDKACVCLGEVLRHSDSTEDIRLGALTVASYLPCLQKRAYGQSITSQDCHDVYESLGAAIGYMQPLLAGDPPQWRMMETAVLAASARIGRPEMLLYPTSPREESSPTSGENHDSYFLLDNKKLAIQQKLFPTKKPYLPHITLLNFQPMLELSYRKNGLKAPSDAADQLKQLLGLITREARGDELEPMEQKFMNHISRAIAYHHQKAEQALAA